MRPMFESNEWEKFNRRTLFRLCKWVEFVFIIVILIANRNFPGVRNLSFFLSNCFEWNTAGSSARLMFDRKISVINLTRRTWYRYKCTITHYLYHSKIYPTTEFLLLLLLFLFSILNLTRDWSILENDEPHQ